MKGISQQVLNNQVKNYLDYQFYVFTVHSRGDVSNSGMGVIDVLDTLRGATNIIYQQFCMIYPIDISDEVVSEINSNEYRDLELKINVIINKLDPVNHQVSISRCINMLLELSMMLPYRSGDIIGYYPLTKYFAHNMNMLIDECNTNNIKCPAGIKKYNDVENGVYTPIYLKMFR